MNQLKAYPRFELLLRITLKWFLQFNTYVIIDTGFYIYHTQKWFVFYKKTLLGPGAGYVKREI